MRAACLRLYVWRQWPDQRGIAVTRSAQIGAVVREVARVLRASLAFRQTNTVLVSLSFSAAAAAATSASAARLAARFLAFPLRFLPLPLAIPAATAFCTSADSREETETVHSPIGATCFEVNDLVLWHQAKAGSYEMQSIVDN